MEEPRRDSVPALPDCSGCSQLLTNASMVASRRHHLSVSAATERCRLDACEHVFYCLHIMPGQRSFDNAGQTPTRPPTALP